MFSRIPANVYHRILPKLSVQNAATSRYIHLYSKTSWKTKTGSNYGTIATSFVRYNSTIPEIPETPLSHIQYHTNGEATFESLGLGGNSPIGIIQNLFEWLHIGWDLPWWSCMLIATTCIRICIFPITIKMQRHAANMQVHMPQLMHLQNNLKAAKLSSNPADGIKAANELSKFMMQTNFSMSSIFLPIFVQLPLFISFYWGIKGMVDVPVESLKEGGLWWFTDFTQSDPLYILPLTTCSLILLIIELGVDSAGAPIASKFQKILLRIIPIVSFTFLYSMPSAICFYWTYSNIISLAQHGLLKIPRIRTFFNLPLKAPLKVQKTEDVKQGFVKGFKESWENIKISTKVNEIQNLNRSRVMNAGRGPMPRTRRNYPTKEEIENAKKRL
ncbi:mitochondrial inner membrane protein OXA1L-like [Prorops nasuta]|uniref:mitochondrial inner membrane protein OXA1L-like n=1 Tax=Prorops nasuta TaxID=863751 RepID=UPI0034CF12AF